MTQTSMTSSGPAEGGRRHAGWRDLERRDRRDEWMDQPGLDPSLHLRALRALTRVNRVTGSVGRIWREVRPLAALGGPIRVLDLACGSGEVAHGIARRAARAGLEIEVHGCDISPRAVDYARRRGGGSKASFFEADLLTGPLPEGYDAMVSSLFLHHLDEAEAVRLLRRMAAATRLVVVNDLMRSVSGYFYATLGSRLLTWSPVVRVDAPLSVRAAFRPEELGRLAAEAGLEAAEVRRAWPEQMVLVWRAS